MKREQLIAAMARLVAGLHVPVSLGMPLGGARDAYMDVRGALNDFGWSNADEIERRMRDILDHPETA